MRFRRRIPHLSNSIICSYYKVQGSCHGQIHSNNKKYCENRVSIIFWIICSWNIPCVYIIIVFWWTVASEVIKKLYIVRLCIKIFLRIKQARTILKIISIAQEILKLIFIWVIIPEFVVGFIFRNLHAFLLKYILVPKVYPMMIIWASAMLFINSAKLHYMTLP